ncbi:uncharacterized protein At3g28850-like [Pyrus x bretschneideri]|uniref:uncharacterized protein At3g28850-like n=1 Tax=Pyrus x bretschneideri TaxID=225117 RepID=UPI0020301733|nr:uncharacterized protein At3g28850-like [Pyrus x bretschneideri]
MGCSASRPLTLLTKNPEQNSQIAPTSFQDSSNSSPLLSTSRRALSISSAPLVHHPPLRKGDTHHLVSLTSTTYGSLRLDPPSPLNPLLNLNGHDSPEHHPHPQQHSTSSPDSVINTWELMDGLNDSDFHSHFSAKHPIYDRPIAFPEKASSCRYSRRPFDSLESAKYSEVKVEDALPAPSSSSSNSKPLWQHLSEESLLSKMDPNVVLTYRRALSSRQSGDSSNNRCNVVRSFTCTSTPLLHSPFSNACFCLPGAEDKIVIYFTTLRGIRKTYEDCCAVRMIFRGFRVAVDERDVSMDSEYRKELQNAVGDKVVSLPQVFVRGKYVGGAEEVKQLNEAGELGKLLRGFPVRDGGFVCEGCGDARFAPCPTCNGSRKLFDEDEGELRRCQDCNENGLIRCPACCL